MWDWATLTATPSNRTDVWPEARAQVGQVEQGPEGGGHTAVSAFVKLPCGSRWHQLIPGKGEWEGLATLPSAWSDQGPWEEIPGWGRKSLP